MKKILLSLYLLGIVVTVSAQVGGSAIFPFLEIPASARVAALGGTYISAKDGDLSCGMQAPSLLNPEMDKSLSLSAVAYADGAKFGDAAYAFTKGKAGTFMAGMHYASYGQFLETDDFGNIQGTFHAADYCMQLGWGYQYNHDFSVGAAIKTIYSDYYIYNALGFATDISATYTDTITHWTITLEGRNIGATVNSYVEGNSEPLPGEALFGASKRLAHTPLRFNLTYRHLERMDLSYLDVLDKGDVDPLTGIAQQKKINFANKFSRHFIFAAEILLSKNFNLRASYNFERRRELSVDTRPGLVGFSFGAGIKISKFVISYGFARYHLAAAANHFSISTNLAEFMHKAN